MSEISEIVAALRGSPRTPAVLATLVEVSGSSYRRPGARLLIRPGLPMLGSISGGCLEEDAALQAKIVAATRTPKTITYDTTSDHDLIWGVGLGCHGIIRVLLEPVQGQDPWIAALARNLATGRSTPLAVTWQHPDPAQLGTRLAAAIDDSSGAVVYSEVIEPAPSLYIFGGGDDAMPLAEMSHTLGWHSIVCDPRAAYATSGRFPRAVGIHVAPVETLVAVANPPSNAFVVVMTHHYLRDLPILRQLLERPLAYLGLLGPRQRAERLLGEIAREKHREVASLEDRVHAPVGLDLGAENAPEIALAILAEMQATLRNRDARPLRQRLTSIHG